MKMTVPTMLTLLRIVLIPVLVVVFYLPYDWTNFAAALVVAFASATDWLDGWIARRWNQYSAFGAFLDPVADKLMVATALFLIVQSKTVVQMVALTMLLYQVPWLGLPVFTIGEWLLAGAALLTLWSGYEYLRAAWPSLREQAVAGEPPGVDRP